MLMGATLDDLESSTGSEISIVDVSQSPRKPRGLDESDEFDVL
jgi:hypothetical protein